jgi:dipeptidyl aminopeptidase/acylaminoacyl peptidase
VSHDGKRVVYQRGEWTVNRFTDNLYTARIDGTHVQRLAASDEWEGDPSWSPHDDWIVFESSADRGGRYTVYVVESNGGTRTRVMQGTGAAPTGPRESRVRPELAPRARRRAWIRRPSEVPARDAACARCVSTLAEQRPVRGAVLVDATASRDGDISASADSFAANYRRRAGR